MSDATVAKKPRETDDVPVPPTLRKSLKNRHIQLIALGGAIGTGLFYGSSESIQLAGPAILLADRPLGEHPVADDQRQVPGDIDGDDIPVFEIEKLGQCQRRPGENCLGGQTNIAHLARKPRFPERILVLELIGGRGGL